MLRPLCNEYIVHEFGTLYRCTVVPLFVAWTEAGSVLGRTTSAPNLTGSRVTKDSQ